MKRVRFYLILGLVLLLSVGCNTTKFVPQGEYLLNKANIRIEDKQSIPASELDGYLRQKQNSEIFGFWKLQLDIYNTASLDTAKWTSKNARKMGEAPVIFSPELTKLSCSQLTAAMQNKGFFRAKVDTTMSVKDRKVDLTYHVTAGEPYFVRKYNVKFEQNELMSIARNPRGAYVTEGMQFDASQFDQERQRITNVMRRTGRYYFDKEMLQFTADSTVGNKQVDVTLSLKDFVDNLTPEQKIKIFRRYHIGHVIFHIDYDVKHVPENDSLQHSYYNGYQFTWVGKSFLREKMLMRICPIRPGSMYNENAVEQAYSKLNQLAPIKYVDISFDPVGEDELDCHIVLSRSKLNSVSAEVEGTYSAGDWGIGLGVGYQNRNLFRGAEEFSINAKGSYEWRQNGGRAIEAKADLGLKFPTSYAIKVGYQYQNRPDEYIRTISTIGLDYNFLRKRNLQHGFHIIDISYVYLPYIDSVFREKFMRPENILRYSYENHFIVGASYYGNYTSFNKRLPLRSYFTANYNMELAGNVLNGIYEAFHLTSDADGKHTLFGVPFSQYAKADAAFTYHQIINEQHRLVFHTALGVAYPYGNSEVIPFEKRYFSGGANSVRGWMARSLGPGNFRSAGSQIDYNSQAGDIKLDLSLEYRFKVWRMLELAAFFDAGNIWTIADYSSQPYGKFEWNNFYKQIAMAYGWGIRLDFSFFIFRVDVGVKLFDPTRTYYKPNTEWRTASNGLCWGDDVTWHFAIGYPF